MGPSAVTLCQAFGGSWIITLKILSYDHPLIPEYRSALFKKTMQHYKTKLEHLFFQDPRFAKRLQDYWTYYIPLKKSKKKQKTRQWTPKIYICVGASAYWPFILRLIKKYKKSKTQWKFYMAPSGYDRPDKIVFYFESGSQLRQFVKKLRPLLPKTGLHALSHTASTAEMGIESEKRRGIFVGIDPPLRGQSWRLYRSLCIAWADVNTEYLSNLKGGRNRWLARMNLSPEHEGPYSLSPPKKNIGYVRKYWRIINS
jgi:hypothetical protein